MFLKRGKGIRLLIAILLIAALAPGATVLCLSSSGHIALESQLAPCCAALPAPSHDGAPSLSAPVEEGCAGCRDIPVVGVAESRVRAVSTGNDCPLFARVEPETLWISPGFFEESLSADAVLSFATPPSSDPLRC